MWTSVSNTAEYGGLSRRGRLITDETRKEMDAMLKEIQEGKFAKEWMKDAKSGMKKMEKLEKAEAESDIEVVGKKIRSLFEMQAPVAAKKVPSKKRSKKVEAKKAPVKKPVAKSAVKRKPAKKTVKK